MRATAALIAALMATAIAVPGANALGASASPAAIPAAQDPDLDGLPSDWEVLWSRTDPHKADTDRDGRKDGIEDPDHDGLTNRLEFRLGLDPRKADTDGDGRKDSGEDADHDGLTNLQEVGLGLNAGKADTDGDGIPDGQDDLDGDRLSNRFEIHRSRTDARDPDSDHDGIRDGAEDPDHDLLSNAGEEAVGTDPYKADSDGDGQNDWHGDADHDGASNGMEQDQRPVPAGLSPALNSAAKAFPPGYADGCHVTGEVPYVCSYYGTKRSRSAFLVGDSHALQWQPALMDIARRYGWRLYVSTKSSCPVPTVAVYDTKGVEKPDCDVWRAAVFEDIESIHPDVVIAASRSDYHVVGADAVDSQDNLRLWHDGMVTSLGRLKAAAGSVILLGDTPHWSRIIPVCLKHHLDDISACEDLRSDAISAVRSANDRSAATDSGVSYRSTTSFVCPYDPCPVVIDQFLVARDADHLAPPFVRSISRGVERLLPAVLRGHK